MSMRVLIVNIDKVLVEYISSHRRGVLEKGVHRNFANFTGKNLCRSLFLIKFFKKRLNTGVFL